MSAHNSAGASAAITVPVLVVDDEALIQQLVATPLEESGFKVVVASNGDQATVALQNDPVRAVATDIDLKGALTGWDVARRARELHPGTPVVYVTGANVDEWAAQGVPDSLLIAKPFVPAQMVTAVSQLLNAAVTTANP